MRTTVSKTKESSHTPRKVAYGKPVVIQSSDGLPLYSAMVMVVPDEAKDDYTKPNLPGFPTPTVITRSRAACMTRQWRNDPARAREDRNFPTMGDLIHMLIHQALVQQTLTTPAR